jgi:hypothetical protein
MILTTAIGDGASHWTRPPEITALAGNLSHELGSGAEQAMPQALSRAEEFAHAIP